ncbi:MAG TPA: hypothetical protein VFS83_05600 [Ktedonobacterales bacterium]|nr:hypothetical protein [Ktedonobacterales bacterium]
MRPALKLRCLALLLSMLLLSACGRAAVTPSATETPLPPTPTPFPTQPPVPTVAVIQSGGQPVWGNVASWSHANLPTGFGMQFHVSDLRVAASDGRTAYACAVPGDQTQPGHPHVVVTHNGGASWAYATDIPVTWYSCDDLAVDMLNPAVVVALGDFVGDGTQEATFDGGQSWQALPLPPQQAILQLATRGNVTYALMSKPNVGPNGAGTILAESDDHLHTWREIDANLAPMNLRQFWINPTTGALLLQTFTSGLWTSTDDGATWEQMGIPTSGAGQYMVRQSPTDQAWHLCAEYYGSQNATTGSLLCTADGGHAWYQPPAAPFWQMAGIASDGALLVYDEGFMVYRLPAGATRWQKLGAAPHTGCCIQYVPASAGGMLWMFPAESDGAGAPPDPRAIYSARYPY